MDINRICVLLVVYFFCSVGFATEQYDKIEAKNIAYKYSLGLAVLNPDISFQRYYGSANLVEDFFPIYPTEFNLTLSIALNSWLDCEFGLEILPKKTHEIYLEYGDELPGVPNALLFHEWQIWKSSFLANSFSFGFTVRKTYSDMTWVEPMGFVGLSVTQLQGYLELVDDCDYGLPTEDEIAQTRRTLRAARVIPVAKLGAKLNFFEMCSVKILYRWKQYSSFGGIKSKERPDAKAEMRLRNANDLYLEMLIHF